MQYGHQRPFEEIVRRYAGMVFNVCYRITKDKHEAEDATQAVFLTLALQAKRGTDIKALGPWLQQVAKRLALDTRRSKKRRQTREERHQVEQTLRRESIIDDTLPSADMDELKTILHEELQKLPAKYRLPLILHYFGGLSREEMAAELNCKPSTLGVRIFRGREMLAGRLSSRGINISMGALAIALGFAVKRAVSESLIASTSYAATAMIRGHDGAGFASAHVIGLTRRATSAMTLGKVKLTAITLLLAGTSLGAGAKALGMLPAIDVRQIISDQLQRLIRPLSGPLSRPLRVQAPSPALKPALLAAVNLPVEEIPLVSPSVISRVPASPKVSPAATALASISPTPVVAATSVKPFTPSSLRSSGIIVAGVPAGPVTAADTPKTADVSDSVAGEAGGGTGGGSLGLIDDHGGGFLAGDWLPSKSLASSTPVGWDVPIRSNDLVVGAPAKVSSGSSNSSSLSSGQTDPGATPASIVAIASIGGTVTQSSDGIVRGWGTVDRTGTIQMNGKVVADGQGVDRTLDLTSFSSVQIGGAVPAATSMANTAAALGLGDTALNSGGIASASLASGQSGPLSGSHTLASGSAIGGISADSPPPGLALRFVPMSGPPVISPTSASALSQTSSNSPSASNLAPNRIAPDGWYAINHGRLSLPLLACPGDPSLLTWGDDPRGNTLTLVNSVRIAMTSGGMADANEPAPVAISLLSTERSDIPNRGQIAGTTIGLWQVDPNGPELESADLTIRYDALLVSELNAPADSVSLWTYGDDKGVWQPVDPSTFALDTTNDLVSGFGTDIDYFAVAVEANSPYNVDELVAEHLAQFSPVSTGIPAGAAGVPEPVATPLLLLGTAALLGRRRKARTF